MRRSAVAVALVTSLLFVGPSATAQTSTDLAGYLARLGAAQAALRTPGADPSAALSAARAALGLPLAVTMPDGSAVVVTDDALLGTADDHDDAAAVEATETRLADASAAASKVSSATPPDQGRIAAALEEAYGGKVEAPSWPQRVLARIAQVIGWILEHTIGALTRSTIGSVITWLVLIAVAIAIVYFAQRSKFGMVPEAHVRDGGAQATIVDWRRAADDALARGDDNVAVLALYHVLVHTLAARGVVREDPSLTAGECRGAVRREQPALAPSIDRATAAFERVAYGKQDARPGDVDALRAAEQAAKRA